MSVKDQQNTGDITQINHNPKVEMDDHDGNEIRSEANKLIISRDVYTQDAFDVAYKAVTAPVEPLTKRLRERCSCNRRRAWKALTMYLPVIRFAKNYQLRSYLLGDFLSGLTVSFMALPQAMGFGILASLRPIHGLYTTLFPLLLYLVFGTSPYISFGTNALMALLTETVVQREAHLFISSYETQSVIGNVTTGPSDDEVLAIKVGTAMTCSFLVGIFLTAIGVLRLGRFITSLLSVSFIGGFTTAAAVHIASSQIPKLFGIKITSYSGAGKLIRMYIDLFSKIGQTNPTEITMGILSMIVLLIVKICINERYRDKMKIPVPIDLIVVIIATLVSHLAAFSENYNVTIVGKVPSGFDQPTIPRFTNAGNVVADAIVMGILSLAMSISMAKLTANRHAVQIDDNQELIAYGASNLLSSFFGCFPSATAPPRTMILSSLGAKTTFNALPTAVFMLFVIVLIGPLFTSLPLSVLAAMIIVSIKDLLLQYRNIPRVWNVNKYDFIVWTATNSIGVLVDLNYGVIAGVAISVFLVVIQNQLASGYLVGVSQKEDLLVNVRNHYNVEQLSGIRIFRFPTSLYFATIERFKSQLYKEVLNPQMYKKSSRTVSAVVNGRIEVSGDKHTQDLVHFSSLQKVHAVIIDCSVMSYIDMGGVNMLQQVIHEYRDVNVTIILTGLLESPKKVLDAAGFFKTFPSERVFVDTFDAIVMLKGTVETSSDVSKM